MNTLYFYFILLFFVFGSIVGSFLNVVILRYNTGLALKGRSFCFSCGKKLSWYELVPIFSFLFLKRRCRKCKSKISWQYPSVEFLTGFLFALTFYFFGLSYESILYLFIISILVVISVYDLKHKIIPDGLSYIFSISSLLMLVVSNFQNLSDKFFLLDLLAGPILFLFFYSLWFFSKGKWMGFGDAKLSLGIGWFLGFTYGVSAVILAFWIGAFFAIFVMIIDKMMNSNISKYLNLKTKHLTMKSEIPFAPFLVLGILIVFFLKIDVLSIGNFIL